MGRLHLDHPDAEPGGNLRRGAGTGKVLFPGTVIWNAVSAITVARTPKGDYAKALRALRSRPGPAAPPSTSP